MYAEFPVHIILRELERDSLLPAILFRTARKQCDADVESLARNEHAILPQEQQLRLQDEIEKNPPPQPQQAQPAEPAVNVLELQDRSDFFM